MSILNPYFNNSSKKLNEHFSFQGEVFSNKEEKRVYDIMQEEICSQFGIRAWYLPKEIRTMDIVFGEAIASTFQKKFECALMPQDPVFRLGQDIVQSFGYSIETPCTFYAPEYSIINELKSLQLDGRDFPSPQDLLYIPLLNQIYQINYINTRINTMQQGSPRIIVFYCQTFDLETDRFQLNDLNDAPLSKIDSKLNDINDYPEEYQKEYRSNEIVQCEKNTRTVKQDTNDQWDTLLSTDGLENIFVK